MRQTFLEWLKNEGFVEPPLQRPDKIGELDAEKGVGAFPTYSLPPPKKMKKNLKKN